MCHKSVLLLPTACWSCLLGAQQWLFDNNNLKWPRWESNLLLSAQCMLCISTVTDFCFYHAVYGGFFIVLSYAWGWAVDRERPDAG